MKKALLLPPDKTKWFLLNPEKFDINRLEEKTKKRRLDRLADSFGEETHATFPVC